MKYKLTSKQINIPVSRRNRLILQLLGNGHTTPEEVQKAFPYNIELRTVKVELEYLRELGYVEVV